MTPSLETRPCRSQAFRRRAVPTDFNLKFNIRGNVRRNVPCGSSQNMVGLFGVSVERVRLGGSALSLVLSGVEWNVDGTRVRVERVVVEAALWSIVLRLLLLCRRPAVRVEAWEVAIEAEEDELASARRVLRRATSWGAWLACEARHVRVVSRAAGDVRKSLEVDAVGADEAISGARWTWRAPDGSLALIGIDNAEVRVEATSGWEAARTALQHAEISGLFKGLRFELVVGDDRIAVSTVTAGKTDVEVEWSRRGAVLVNAQLGSTTICFDEDDSVRVRCKGAQVAVASLDSGSPWPLGGPNLEVHVNGATRIAHDQGYIDLGDANVSWDPRRWGQANDPFASRRSGCVVARCVASRASGRIAGLRVSTTGIDIEFENGAALARKFHVEPDDGTINCIARPQFELACGEARIWHDGNANNQDEAPDLDAALELLLRCFLDNTLATADVTLRCGRLECFGVVEEGSWSARRYEDDVWPRIRLDIDVAHLEEARTTLRLSRLKPRGWDLARKRGHSRSCDEDGAALDGGPALTLDLHLPKTRIPTGTAATLVAAACARLERRDGFGIGAPSFRFSVRCDGLEVATSVPPPPALRRCRATEGHTTCWKEKRRRALFKLRAAVRLKVWRRRGVVVLHRLAVSLHQTSVDEPARIIEAAAAAARVVDETGAASLVVDTDGQEPPMRCRIDVCEARLDSLLQGARIDATALGRIVEAARSDVAPVLGPLIRVAAATLVDSRVTFGPCLVATIGELTAAVVARGEDSKTVSARASDIAVVADPEADRLLSLRALHLDTEATGRLRR